MVFNVGDKAQNFENAEKPGEYRLVSKIGETNFNPGDVLNLEQFITGYGLGSGFKVVAYLSSNIIDENFSEFNCGYNQDSLKNREIMEFGGNKEAVTNEGISFTLGEVNLNNWPRSSAVPDVDNGGNFISTEKRMVNAPLTYSLKLSKKIKPGNHYLSFYMTYFNGSQWVCQEEKITFKVNNSFEKFSGTLSLLAAAALVVTIYHDGLYPIYETAKEAGITSTIREQWQAIISRPEPREIISTESKELPPLQSTENQHLPASPTTQLSQGKTN